MRVDPGPDAEWAGGRELFLAVLGSRDRKSAFSRNVLPFRKARQNLHKVTCPSARLNITFLESFASHLNKDHRPAIFIDQTGFRNSQDIAV